MFKAMRQRGKLGVIPERSRSSGEFLAKDLRMSRDVS